MKTKPFDFDAVLRGEPVVTKSGKMVYNVSILVGPYLEYPIRGFFNGAEEHWTKNGELWLGEHHAEDLLMLDESLITESMADAALDMYEALKLALSDMEYVSNNYPETSGLAIRGEAIAKARAAIARAEGK